MLAWRRTALSMVAAGALVAHVASDAAGPALAVVLLGMAGVVAFAWLVPGQRVAAAGLGLVIGVVLLGGLALLALGTA